MFQLKTMSCYSCLVLYQKTVFGNHSTLSLRYYKEELVIKGHR